MGLADLSDNVILENSFYVFLFYPETINIVTEPE